MHASYEDFLNTPMDVIMQDLDFHRYEQEVKQIKYQEAQNQNKG